MKTKFNTLLLILLLPLTVLSQKELTKEQILEDYTIIKKVLMEGHPSLYEYTSKSEWGNLFADFENNEVKAIKNSTDLYRSITHLLDNVRDGHLIVMRPPLETLPKMFPLLLKIINTKFYTDTDDFDIPIGSEIISIDGKSGTELRNRLIKYAPADGFNTSKKDRQVEREFGILHYYEFGEKPYYKVEYKTPSGKIIRKNIESQTFQSIGRRFAKRNSYFKNNTLGKKEPFLYFVDSSNTAVLTINTFHMNAEKFQSAIKEVFKDIKHKKTKNLIIDVRQNEGGYPINAIKTFSYIATEPFKQRESSEVTTSTLPEKSYSTNLVNGFTYETFFKKYYQNEEKNGNKWISTKDENKSLMVPNKKRFKGKVFILIGGKTFSAGSSFALFCKNENITLIGEETGGNYYTQTGGYPVIYSLPNSAIKILVPFVKVNRFVKDKTIKKGYGIPPDEKVYLSVQDLINKEDSQLNYILKKTQKK